MVKKQVIRLTESDLHNIIKESVSQILLERNVGEKGMTDDEAINRRLENFIDDYDDVYGDSIYNDEQENYRNKMNQKRLLKHRLTQNHELDEMVNRLSEGKKKQKPRTGTIEMNGEHIRATEDGLDKYGNPMYKVKHPSIKGRKTKDGYTRVQHYNFKPDRVD